MSSRQEHHTHTTGTHRANDSAQTSAPRRRTAGTDQERLSARYEPYLDGLFTYCLSVLCEHDAATAVLGDVLAIAERQRGRRPADDNQRRAWLYALARWACLQRLAARGAAPAAPALSEAAATQRHRELGALAWPEAAGITPEQREALELAVRHHLAAEDVAAVLGMEHERARALLSSAACEVERTRAALVVVERGSCTAVARLTGDSQVLLGTALRRELVRHVDDCPDCRRTAERASVGGPWPGSTALPGKLPVLEAPRTAVYAAMKRALDARARGGPRFDRSGFPLDPKDRVARRRRMRSRAMTTTVIATVVAAPVLALWAAYWGTPMPDETEGSTVFSAEASSPGGFAGHPYEKAGSAKTRPEPRSRFTAASRSPDVSVEVVDTDGRSRHGHRHGPGRKPSARHSSPHGRPDADRGPGRLTVDAQPNGDDATLITLSASGRSAVRWSVHTDSPWLRPSHRAGKLRPGESVTITVSVHKAREPEGTWTGRVVVDPAGTVITIHGRGPEPTPTPKNPKHGPKPSKHPKHSPSPNASQDPAPTG